MGYPKRCLFLFVFSVQFLLGYSQGCVNWVTGYQPNNTESVNAYDYLCAQGIIAQNQNVNLIFNYATRVEIARLLYNTILGTNSGLPSDYNPAPYVDLSQLSIPDQNAMKAMLYLDYQDGVSPFPRDYYFTGASYYPFRKSDVIRALLESFNIPPDSTGYNSSSSGTTFLTDITYQDPCYGWLRKASLMGLLDSIPYKTTPDNVFDTIVQPYFTDLQIVVLVFRLMNLYGYYPSPTTADFFVPNNYSIDNINNKAGIDRGVFSSYEQPSFSIKGGGLPLMFFHSYHSELTEIPYYNSEYIYPTFYTYYQLYQQSSFPIGIGWTHSYNISIASIMNFDTAAQQWVEVKLAVQWADATVDFYDKALNSYITPAIQDSFNILNQSGGFATDVEIVKTNGLRYRFNKLDDLYNLKLVSITDRNGNSISLLYQQGYSTNVSIQRLSAVQDNVSGRQLTFSYLSGTNLINSVTDLIGRVVYFAVDPYSLDLNYYQDAKTQQTHYNYATGSYPHLLSTITRPNGNTIDNTYNQRHLLSTSSNGSSYQVDVQFNTNYLSSSQTTSSDVTTYQNGQQLTEHYEQNDRGNPTKIISTTKNISITYDSYHVDLPYQIFDSISNITKTYQYDANGNATYTSISNPSAGTIITQATYNNYSEPTTTIDGNGNAIFYTYDTHGNLTRIDEPNTITTQFQVDGNGNPIWKEDPIGLYTDYTYNNYGNLNTITLRGSGISASSYYDGASRVSSIVNPRGVIISYLYDNNDNLTDQNVDTASLNYNTHYTFDANDNMTQIRDPRSLTTDLVYDFNTDDLISEIYGSYTKVWTYNTDGSINTYKDKNGNIFNHTYYPATDPRAGMLQSDGYVQNSFNASTKLLESVSRVGTTNQLSYTYDGFQRVKSIAYNDNIQNNTVSYEYDNNSNLTKITYPYNNTWYVTYEYNANNRMTGIKDWNGRYIVQYIYRANGQLQNEILGNGVSTYYHYDSIGRLDSIYSISPSSVSLVASVGATSDVLGNHTRESYYVGYPDSVQLTELNSLAETGYAYDNINRLNSTLQTSYTYDGNGCETVSNTNQYTYDLKGNMLSRTTPYHNFTMEYDPLENRRQFDTSRFALDILGQSSILLETDTSGHPNSIYVDGLGLVCRIDPNTGKFFYYHYDFRGSTIAITDDSANIVGGYEYEPFGGIMGYKQPPFANHFTYIGKQGVMQDDTNMYYMRDRYYQPSNGRFIAEDPVWSTNLFPYAGNNPVANIDPNGKSLIDAYATLFKGTADILNYAITNTLNGKILGTGLVQKWHDEEENKYIQSYVKGKPNNFAFAMTGISALWTSDNFKTTIGALTFNPEIADGTVVTSVIGKTGLLGLVDMRTSFGIALKATWSIKDLSDKFDLFHSTYENIKTIYNNYH